MLMVSLYSQMFCLKTAGTATFRRNSSFRPVVFFLVSSSVSELTSCVYALMLPAQCTTASASVSVIVL